LFLARRYRSGGRSPPSHAKTAAREKRHSPPMHRAALRALFHLRLVEPQELRGLGIKTYRRRR
jgi:hypothetical protein